MCGNMVIRWRLRDWRSWRGIGSGGHPRVVFILGQKSTRLLWEPSPVWKRLVSRIFADRFPYSLLFHLHSKACVVRLYIPYLVEKHGYSHPAAIMNDISVTIPQAWYMSCCGKAYSSSMVNAAKHCQLFLWSGLRGTPSLILAQLLALCCATVAVVHRPWSVSRLMTPI